jgi:hypothetical protein
MALVLHHGHIRHRARGRRRARGAEVARQREGEEVVAELGHRREVSSRCSSEGGRRGGR